MKSICILQYACRQKKKALTLGKAVVPKTVLLYEDKHGKTPYAEWFTSLKDVSGKKRIGARIRRLEAGLYGDCEPVGEEVNELRMFFGPGYRVYFGEEGDNIVILLCGGDKSTQKQDIKTAQGYWKEYQDHG